MTVEIGRSGLVVEVVSPSTGSDDYRAKWVEYAALDIEEWVNEKKRGWSRYGYGFG